MQHEMQILERYQFGHELDRDLLYLLLFFSLLSRLSLLLLLL